MVTESAELIQKVREALDSSTGRYIGGYKGDMCNAKRKAGYDALDRLSALMSETACNLDRCLGGNPTGQGREALTA
jgi:hypothetical protein